MDLKKNIWWLKTLKKAHNDKWHWPKTAVVIEFQLIAQPYCVVFFTCKHYLLHTWKHSLDDVLFPLDVTNCLHSPTAACVSSSLWWRYYVGLQSVQESIGRDDFSLWVRVTAGSTLEFPASHVTVCSGNAPGKKRYHYSS